MEAQTPNPQILPSTPMVPAKDVSAATEIPVAPVANSGPGRKTVAIAGAVLFLLAAIVALFFSRSRGGDAIPVKTTPTPTPQTTPIVLRALSPLATESAFLTFEQDLTTIATAASGVQIQNQQLLPPRLELPLGF